MQESNAVTAELVRMEHISQMFGRVQALDDVSLAIKEREIIGLVGDNGAGKSTLIKILSGAYKATNGEIYFQNNLVKLNDTWDAIELGIETIYQDSALVPQLSIMRNLFGPRAGPQASFSEST